MTSIASAAATPAAGSTGQVDPELAQIIAQLPPDQRAAAMAQVQAMSPAQQQQLKAQLAAAASQHAAAPGAAGTASPAGAQAAAGAATLPASPTAPPSTVKTVLKNVAIFGGIGAALGFGASFLSLPVIGTLGAPVLAAIGGGIGAVIGAVKGLMSAKKQQAAYAEAQAAAAQAQEAAAAQAPGLPPGSPATDPGSAAQTAGTAPPADAPNENTGPATKYTVRPGDTLSAIGRRYDLTWQQLYAANKAAVGSNPNLIHPGLELVIPAE